MPSGACVFETVASTDEPEAARTDEPEAAPTAPTADATTRRLAEEAAAGDTCAEHTMTNSTVGNYSRLLSSNALLNEVNRVLGRFVKFNTGRRSL